MICHYQRSYYDDGEVRCRPIDDWIRNHFCINFLHIMKVANVYYLSEFINFILLL